MLNGDSIKSRLLEYCRYSGIPVSRFEKDAGLSNGYFNQVKKQPSLDKLDSIRRAFPNLSLDWLVYGSGDMLNSSILEQDNWITASENHVSNKHGAEALRKTGLRIDEVAELKKMDYKTFAKRIGVDYGELVSTINANKGADEHLLNKILAAFPDINPCWLIAGTGKALLDTKRNTIRPTKPYGIPLIPIEAVAGFGHGDQAGVCYEDCEHYTVPEFMERGVEFLIRVSGSSMYPKYANGDILACKKIHEILFIQWGKVHVIESASQGALVKRIFEHDTDTIRCVSDNKENYPAFLMPKSDIRSLSIVLGVIRLE